MKIWPALLAVALVACSDDDGGSPGGGADGGPSDGADSGRSDTLDGATEEEPDGSAEVPDGSVEEPDGSVEEPDAGADAGPGDELLEVAEFEEQARNFAAWGACTPDLHPILGYAPVTEGQRYPLFVWVVGTLATYNSEDVHLVLREMASRGFVAVSPQYDDFIINGCPNLREKAMCLFDAEQPDSMTATLCARADVDCGRGILVAGHSQGSQIGLLAKNYEERVRAHWGLSSNCDYMFNQDTGLCDPAGEATDTRCLLDEETVITPDRVRVITGESDDYGTPIDFERMTGVSCPEGQLDCLAEDGSGWYRVADTAVQDGHAEHCFIVNSTDGAWCPGLDEAHPLDVGWVPPAREEWSLLTNLEWLAGFADR